MSPSLGNFYLQSSPGGRLETRAIHLRVEGGSQCGGVRKCGNVENAFTRENLVARRPPTWGSVGESIPRCQLPVVLEGGTVNNCCTEEYTEIMCRKWEDTAGIVAGII